MRGSAVGAIFILSLAGAAAWAQTAGPGAATSSAIPPQYISLISATNYVSELRARKDSVLPEEAILATKKACEGLSQIVNDKHLLQALRVAAPRAGQVDGINEVLRNHVDRFLDEFLRPEMDLLTTAGLTSQSVDQIIHDGFELKSNFYLGKYEHVDERIQKDLELFTNEVCRAAREAHQLTASKTRDGLVRLATGLGGAAVVAIDAVNLENPIATVSISWGLNALSESVKGAR